MRGSRFESFDKVLLAWNELFSMGQPNTLRNRVERREMLNTLQISAGFHVVLNGVKFVLQWGSNAKVWNPLSHLLKEQYR